MKKILFIFYLSLFVLAKLNVVVSIAPQKTFLKAIGKEMISVSVMVPMGSSPHTYEPKPSQMKDISKAAVYFLIGVEFEKAWIKRFTNQNQNIELVDLTKDINKIKIGSTNHVDPHIWNSPKNVIIMAKSILSVLQKKDKKNAKRYQKNYLDFITSLKQLDKKINSYVKNKKNFMVFHPSWRYFARDYNLKQIAIEFNGKNPKPKDIIKLIKFAKKEHIKTIIVSPEFSDKAARLIAKTLKINVTKISPLNPNYNANLLNLAKSIR